MAAKQITYTASYITEGGETVTAERTDYRPYTHAAVVDWGKEFPGTGIVIASFHSSEKLALKGSLTGQQTAAGAKVIAAVPVTVKADETPAPVADATETKTDLSTRVDAAYAAAEAKKSNRKPTPAKPRKAKKTANATPATEAEATPSSDDIEKAAAELSSEAAPGLTGSDAIKLIEVSAEHGKLGSSRAQNLVGCFKRVMKVTGHSLDTDLRDLNASEIANDFVKKTPELLGRSHQKYVLDFQRTVKLALDYLADPEKWNPSVRNGGTAAPRRTRQGRHQVTLADGSTLRVVCTPGVDLRAALEAALDSLNDPAPQGA